MKKWISGFLGISLMVLGMGVPAFADENEIGALKEQIEKLNKRLSELEGKVEQPTNIVPGGAPSGNFIEGAMSGVRLTGFVDTAYHWNFQSPVSPAAPAGTAVTRDQSLGVFDTVADSFTLHAVEVALEKPAPETGGVGFRTDLFYGQDAKVIASVGTEVDDFDLQQAYVEARLPLHALEGNSFLGDSLYLRAGKYVTLAGAEVIEARDNWNTTRSYMFGYAIPFTHTGVRGAYDLWGGKVTLTTGVNNGWDIVEDNNSYKTWEGQIALKPSDRLLFTTTLYVGPENPNQAGHKRFLMDYVALWNVTDKLSLMANFDFGNERRVVAGQVTGTAEKSPENAQWHGYALYGRYQVNDKLAFATRGELFVDDDVFRVGAGAISTGAARERHYWDWTYTTEYKLYENLISRLEYRYNWSDAPIFEGESSQSTLSAQLIYNFA